jgi:hypothetical protein
VYFRYNVVHVPSNYERYVMFYANLFLNIFICLLMLRHVSALTVCCSGSPRVNGVQVMPKYVGELINK